MTLKEIEDFLANREVPAGTMLNKATKITDPETFLRTNLNAARAWQGDLEKYTSFWHLRDLVAVLKDKSPTAGNG